tara:strand:- start:153 stop:506 length:354 start_codon:yes stop_codon:yes gene_type:complete
MKYLKNNLCVIFTLFALSLGYSQSYKDDISIVLYSAEFIKNDDFSLKPFKEHNTNTFYLAKSKKIHADEKIIYLPTICLYNNGDLILKIEAGISMKLPESTTERLTEKIDQLLEDRF